ncbi:EamA family transporter [Niveibacterium umoris]|uniref:EamA family transporter n=1 Tax=Niveibacterium umoris TaxID=1193620 RepID=UPI001621CE12
MIALQVVVAFIWGGTWIAGRIVAAEMPPLAAAGWRFLLGTLTLGLLVWHSAGKLPRIGRADLARILAMGFTGILAYNLCFFYGLQHVQAGRGALVIALNPVAVALAAWLLMGEALSLARLAGVAIALAGCLMVIGRGDPLALLRGEIGSGEIAILGCVAGWCAYTLIGRRVSRTLAPLTMTFYASVAGGLMLLCAGLAEGSLRTLPVVSWHAVAALLYLGILGSGFSYVWYAQGVMRLGAARAAVFINLVPISAVLLAALILDEHVGMSVLAGGVLVLAGVWLTNLRNPGGRG